MMIRWMLPCLLLLAIGGCKFDASGEVIPVDPFADGQRVNGYDRFGCGFGFVYNEETDNCDCPDNYRTFGDRDCYELPTNFYHSDMAGCFSDLGMTFEITQDTGAYFSTINAYQIDVNQMRPRIDNRTNIDLNKVYLRDLGNGRDSVFMQIRYFTHYNAGEENFFKMNLLGVSNRQDSIYGMLSFNRDNDPLGTANEFSSCDVVFVRSLE